MAQTSLPFDGKSYNANTWDDANSDLFCAGRTTKACVIKGIGGNLSASGAATPIELNSGAAIVLGKYYNNSAASSLNVVAPATATRTDLIVLRINWSACAIVAASLVGTEGAGSPALTTVDGTTWEVPLWKVDITTGSVITLTNRRVWAKTYGLHNKYDVKMFSGSFSGHYPIDPDLGSADTDWHLANGDTENTVVTPNLAGYFIIAAGSSHAAGTTGGQYTVDTRHQHSSGSIAAANESAHQHSSGSIAAASESTHTHGGGNITTNTVANHQHNVNAAAFGSGTGGTVYGLDGDPGTMTQAGGHSHSISSGSTAAGTSHTHTLSGSTDVGTAHTHSISGSSATGGASALDVTPTYYSLSYIVYVGA